MSEKAMKWIASNLDKAYQLLERAAVVLCPASLFLLAAPSVWLEWLQVSGMVASHRGWLGIIFVLSTLLNLATLFGCLARWVRRGLADRRIRKQTVDLVNTLDADQLKVMHQILSSGQNAHYVHETAAVSELVFSGFLERVPDSHISLYDRPLEPRSLVRICPELKAFIRERVDAECPLPRAS